jgi:prephenate dehydratase
MLVGALQELAQAGINMTKLESRPSKAVLGQYIFLVDVEGHRTDTDVAHVLEQLTKKTGMLKVFGSYPRWRSK